jgi:hypothetical protein
VCTDPVYTLRSLTVKLACMNRGSTACHRTKMNVFAPTTLHSICSPSNRGDAGGGAPYRNRPLASTPELL